jgi:pimeloyl-ACP methyl ester carboxylesterase
MASRVTGIELRREGEGEPLLLLHGTGCDRSVWKPVLPGLASRRRLLLVDLPGHGGSDPPPAGVPHTPAGYAERLEGMLDELGLETAHIAGNSVGGWTALELAKRGRARSVAALSPAGLWARRDPWRCVFQLWSQRKLGRAFGRVTPPLLRSAAGRTILMRGTVGRPRRMQAADAVEMFETYASTPDFDQHLAQTRRERFAGGTEIAAPVTVAWGECDRLLPGKARLLHELPAHTRVVSLPGCGHVPMWDDPELVVETILGAASPPTTASAA